MNGAVFGDTVTFHYRLAAGADETLESTFDADPVVITLGQGQLDPNLERCLVGLAPGETHVFDLDPAQAFGECDPARVQSLPLTDFPADMDVQPKMLIEFALPNGSRLPGTVLERTENEVVVDFNHPLCGCPVRFEVRVLEIRRPGNPAPERR